MRTYNSLEVLTENSSAPTEEYNISIMWLRKMIENSPKTRRIIKDTYSIPPITVKSHLVWKANIVSEKHMRAVIPAAIRI